MLNQTSLERSNRIPAIAPQVDRTRSRVNIFTVDNGPTKYQLTIEQTGHSLRVAKKFAPEKDGQPPVVEQVSVSLNDHNALSSAVINMIISLPREAFSVLPPGFVSNLWGCAERHPDLLAILTGVTRDNYYDGDVVPLGANGINPKKSERVSAAGAKKK